MIDKISMDVNKQTTYYVRLIILDTSSSFKFKSDRSHVVSLRDKIRVIDEIVYYDLCTDCFFCREIPRSCPESGTVIKNIA